MLKKARQLTLFECSKTVSSSSELDSDDNQSDHNEQPVKKARIHCQDSSEETCRGTRPSSVHHAYGASNIITVQPSTGPTTVIINPDASKATESSTEIIKSSSSGDLSGPPVDIADRPGAPLVQSQNIQFPSTNLSGKLWSFNSNWYRDYSWLEYSVSTDAVFCYPCRLLTTGTGKAEKAFTVNGFRDWKHASSKKGVLQLHDKCAVHRGAMFAWEQSKRNASCGTSVAHRLETGRQQQIQNNRQQKFQGT